MTFNERWDKSAKGNGKWLSRMIMVFFMLGVWKAGEFLWWGLITMFELNFKLPAGSFP